MTLTVSPWVVWAVLSLALFGVVFLWRVARGAARDFWAWLREPRIDPPWWWKPWLSGRVEEDERYCYPECPPGCDCSRLEVSALEELPPERSAEALGFTGPPPESPEVRHWHDLEAKRERLASAAELEHRAAYEAMGLEFPSGLLARMREAAP